MALYGGSRLETAVCAAVGLDPRRVRSLTLRLVAGEIAMVDAELFVDTPVSLEGIQLLAGRYRLEEIAPLPKCDGCGRTMEFMGYDVTGPEIWACVNEHPKAPEPIGETIARMDAHIARLRALL